MAQYLQHTKMENCSAREKVKSQVWEQMRLVQQTGQFRAGERSNNNEMQRKENDAEGLNSFKDEDGDDFEAEGKLIKLYFVVYCNHAHCEDRLDPYPF